MGGHKIYEQNDWHYLTLTVVGWVDVFTRKTYRDFIVENLRYCQEQKDLGIYAWVLMSNHLHLIASARESAKLSDILRDFKKFTGRKLLEMISNHPQESRKEWMLHYFSYQGRRNANNRNFQFWQRDNHPVHLISPKWILQKLDYIHNNPVVAGLVEEPQHYLYSSAMNYVCGKGLLEVNIIDLGPSVGFIRI